jgi:hypothetical protein
VNQIRRVLHEPVKVSILMFSTPFVVMLLMFIPVVVQKNCLYFLQRLVLVMAQVRELSRIGRRVQASTIVGPNLALLLKSLGAEAI